MDDPKNISKQMELSEGMRKVLNQAINLLHQASHQKIDAEQAIDELKNLFRAFNFVATQEKGAIEKLHKEAFDITQKTWEKDIPLYEAIMVMNKIIMEIKTLNENVEDVEVIGDTDNIQEKISNSFVKEQRDNIIDPIFKEKKPIEPSVEKEMLIPKKEPVVKELSNGVEIHDLLAKVIDSKKQLQHTICSLNDSLVEVGLQIKEL